MTDSSSIPATIEEWVASLGLAPETAEEYVKIFNDQEVTIAVLPTLSSSDLTEMGIKKIGPRKQIMKAIDDLKSLIEKQKARDAGSEDKKEEKTEEKVPPPSVTISELDRDLDFESKVTSAGITCSPIFQFRFKPIWTGGRATRGVYKGKHWFEFSLTEFVDTKKIQDDLGLGRTGCRVGWSTLDTQVDLLGDTPDSFAYDMTGKKINDRVSADYGDKWGPNDALGCFLDLDLYTVSFSKNGTWLQVAYVIPEQYRGKFFFPHILLKNSKCKVNFGGQPAVTPVPQGYEWIAQASEVNASEGPKAPSSKKECEAILTIGLPFSGKTTWVKKHIKEHPEKRYTVIGTDHLYERMKPWFLPDLKDTKEESEKKKVEDFVSRLYSYAGALVGLLLKLTKDQSPRNYIIDSANVSRQRTRKLDFFSGYGKRIAVVFAPTFAELTKRAEEAKKDASHPVGPTTRLELFKRQLARVLLPEESDYDEIVYVDSSKEDAKKAVAEYIEESKKDVNKPKPPPVRRPTRPFRGRGRGRRGGFVRDNRNDRSDRRNDRGNDRGGRTDRTDRTDRNRNGRDRDRGRGGRGGRGRGGGGARVTSRRSTTNRRTEFPRDSRSDFSRDSRSFGGYDNDRYRDGQYGDRYNTHYRDGYSYDRTDSYKRERSDRSLDSSKKRRYDSYPQAFSSYSPYRSGY